MKSKKASKLPFRTQWRRSATSMCIAVFVSVGIFFLVRGLAATPFLGLEPESGTLATGTTVVTDATASGGRAVKFSAAITPPTPPPPGDNTGGSGGPKTDRTGLSYTANGVTSTYHLYAAGLDWTKRVGVMIYADGSAEFGLKNPSSTYLLAGTNGLINVAKRNNMILVTPLAPGAGCPDGDGTCWYQTSSGYTRLIKTQWAEALVKYIYTLYPLDISRVAMGGYSSGAQLAAQAWVPSGAAQRTMNDGVIVSISCGGPPAVTEVVYTASFKANVHMNWNTGDNDAGCPYTAEWSTTGGYNYYKSAGFQTSLDVLPGVTHDRSGDFGGIMDAQIQEHVVRP
jgi:hypothetical protein